MRKISLILTGLLLLGLLSGCGAKKSASSSAESSAAQEKTLHLKTLNVELARTDDNLDALAKALGTLPETMKSALGEQGVEVKELHVTVGTSASATCEALKGGSVDLAFLPADSFALLEGGKAILAAGGSCPAVKGTDPADWNGAYGKGAEDDVGNRALICAAASEYGANLAGRVSGGGTLKWEELNHARWGVLDPMSQTGYQCAELWLEDHYEGMGVADLSNVKTYSSEKELVSAAAAGEIDVFPVQADRREAFTAEWPEILKQASVLGVSGKLYTWVAAASDKLEDSARFRKALASAVSAVQKSDSSMTLIFGGDSYVPVKDSALNGMRRIQPRGE